MKILYEANYTEDEIAIANKTSRANGASSRNSDGSIRSVVARWVIANVSKDSRILDFGAGSQAVQSQALKDAGFKNVTAYDFGSNIKQGLHDPNALSKKYDVVFASNVINTASSESMVIGTIEEMTTATEPGGFCILNYPSTPRKLGFSAEELKALIENKSGVTLELVAGSRSVPVWKISC